MYSYFSILVKDWARHLSCNMVGSSQRNLELFSNLLVYKPIGAERFGIRYEMSSSCTELLIKSIAQIYPSTTQKTFNC